MLTLILVNLLALAGAQHPVCAARQQTYLDAGCCGEDQATVCVAPTAVTFRNAQPVFEDMDDINAFNPLNAAEASCGGYSAKFTELNGEDIFLGLVVDKLTCTGSFSTSLDPFDTASILYTFPVLVQINYAYNTQASGPRTDTCSFYTPTPFHYTPDIFFAEGTPNTSPLALGLFEQGVCSDLNVSTGFFDTITSFYYYNFTSPEFPVNSSIGDDIGDGWYREKGIPLKRWYA